MKINTTETNAFFVLKRIFVGLILYAGTLGIGYPQNNEHLVMIHQETICRAPWIVFQNDTATSYNLKQLFTKDSIPLFEIQYTGKLRRITCEACGCLTGRNIEITIRRQDQQKAEALGFKRPWVWMMKEEKACDWTTSLSDEQIRQKLLKKKIRASLVLSTTLADKTTTSTNCKTKSGRKLTIKIDREDLKRATNEGYTIDDSVNE